MEVQWLMHESGFLGHQIYSLFLMTCSRALRLHDCTLFYVNFSVLCHTESVVLSNLGRSNEAESLLTLWRRQGSRLKKDVLEPVPESET